MSLRQRPVRHGLVALGAVAALALSGCASSIAGAPVAAEAAPPVSSNNDSGGLAGGDDADGLPTPSDLDSILGGLTNADGSTPDLSDLSSILGGLTNADGSTPDLSQLEGLLGSLGGDGGQMPDLSQLQGLLDSLTNGSGGDISGLLDGLGADGAGVLSPGCLQISGALMSLGMLMVGPVTGTPLTAQQVDDAFKNLTDIPSDLSGDISVLHQALQSVVGKDAATASQVLGSPDVDGAMSHLSEYLDSSCGGN